jgi:alkyldihydroxyacetonephosphate synthase
VAALPPGDVSTDPADLLAAARDHSPLSFLREPVLPRAVVRATSTESVAEVLRWATETRTPIVPRGLGSGACDGAVPGADAVVLDLSSLDEVLEIGDASVRAQAGVRGDVLEAALEALGLTTGHYPQSLAISTVGGWVATASAGQASSGFGAIEDILLGLTVVLADGTVARLRAVPRSAAGPDLRRLVVGSEGTLGVVTEAVLACSPLPREWTWRAYGADRFADALALARDAHGAYVVRGYDEVDAALSFGAAGHESGCVLLLGWPSDSPFQVPELDARRLDDAYGAHWWAHRNDATALYRAIMGPERAWGAGVIVDTLDTAALWPRLPQLYESVRAAVGEHAETIACHVSHTYRAGASLYFTFLVRAADDERAQAAYARAWESGARACLAAGGTLTHHHGVGRLKARFLEEELGEGGLELLRRLKRTLDPAGILNPGALLP